MRLIHLLWLFLSLSVYSNESLKDLPEFTLQNKRWFLPADMWSNTDWMTAKGKYFSISVKRVSKKPLKFFNSKSRLEDAEIVFSGVWEQKSKGVFCQKGYRHPEIKVANYIECTSYHCIDKQGPKEIPQVPYSLDGDWFSYISGGQTYKQAGECPLDIDFHSFRPADLNEATAYRFKYVDYDVKGKFVSVMISGKKYYLDMNDCKERPVSGDGRCEFLDIVFSWYERSWMQLKQKKLLKDNLALNELIQYLLPCVKKRDAACVRKYFVTSKNADLKKNPDLRLFKFLEFEVTENLFKELEACLSYDKLLLHMMGTRGINKVCVFDGIKFEETPLPPKGRSRLISVIYPEGLRAKNHNDEVIYVKNE